MARVRKAVYPVAGMGTRFLPATKVSPKEMLPIIDKPMVQYAVEEALESGIRSLIMVTGRGKRAIEDHFDKSVELELLLEERGETEALSEVRKIANMVSMFYIRQKEPLGLGHAVLCAKDAVGEEDFAVVLGDDLIYSDTPCLKQLLNVHDEVGCSVLCVSRVHGEEISGYGVISYEPVREGVYKVTGLVEKPSPEEAPSNLAIIGRYVLTPKIFEALEDTRPGAKGEIQLTDGLHGLLEEQEIYACEVRGKRYDAGNKLGFLVATVEYALRRKDLGEEFRKYLKSLNL